MEETNINKVKSHAKEAYDGQSRNYKQKLLYGLLAAVRNNDRHKFLNILYTNLNAMNKGGTKKSLVDNLMAEYENIQGPRFETYAYAIIAGILASNDNEMSQKNTQEV
ncbi:MAG: hypothetical protein QW303_02150 [Nitrososphaerota archaeon]